jgi:alcohol dehydrogenase
MDQSPTYLEFDYRPRTRIVFGAGRLNELGSLVQELRGTRALVVSDPGIVQAGHSERAQRILGEKGITSALFAQVDQNPTTETVARGLETAQDFRPDVLIGLGGGSAMDCAKGINFLYTNGGQMQDYWGRNKATKPMLPLVGVPTTAGTGSEAQSFALISDVQTHAKMACGDDKAACRIALLDPELTLTQPARVTALTGIDALAHAVESYVTSARTPLSLAFSKAAWGHLSANFVRVLTHPDDLSARAGMQLGACLAGLAIENSMLGAAHALANPLTAHYGVAHGEAIALMLPHVVRFNSQRCAPWYRELLQSAGLAFGPHPGDELADRLGAWAIQGKLARRLSDLKIDRLQLKELATDAAKQWTAGFNPRPVSATDLHWLYEQAY